MIFKIVWTLTAVNSYHEEIDYIYYKWDLKEVLKFENLVSTEIKRISINPLIGKTNLNDIYSITISKQTTLFYKIKTDLNLIELLVFWNNQKNPEELNKLL
jgi:plasmid stabilization system protein ParE